VVAIAFAVCAFALVRARDFVHSGPDLPAH
jgi:hypothetical protein